MFHSHNEGNYLFQGGIKAVIWTDSIQMVILLIGIIVMLAVGVGKVGGIKDVWDIANEGGRLNWFE